MAQEHSREFIELISEDPKGWLEFGVSLGESALHVLQQKKRKSKKTLALIEKFTKDVADARATLANWDNLT